MAKRMTKAQQRFTNSLKQMGNLTFKQLQINCIVRGMTFDDVINGDFHSLNGYLAQNINQPIDSNTLDAFDEWFESKLKANGSDDLIHPQLRFGFVAETDDDGNITKRKRVKGVKKTKVKKERTKEGIFAGTKKALTFQLASEGVSKADTIAQVIEAFPDAKEKSIGIWYNKAKKEAK